MLSRERIAQWAGNQRWGRVTIFAVARIAKKGEALRLVFTEFLNCGVPTHKGDGRQLCCRYAFAAT